MTGKDIFTCPSLFSFVEALKMAAYIYRVGGTVVPGSGGSCIDLIIKDLLCSILSGAYLKD